MTDHDNADDADGQNSKLSRRTALGLMGASAVGGAAASSAYSQVIADRPIDVAVVSDGEADAADGGGSVLEVTNNTSSEINAEIEAHDDVWFTNLLTNNGQSVTENGSSWTLNSLSGGDTAELEFIHDNSESETVDFDVEAFLGTDGFSVTATRSVELDGYLIPDDSLLYIDPRMEDGRSDGEVINTLDNLAPVDFDFEPDDNAENDGTFEEDSRNGQPAYNLEEAPYNEQGEFTYIEPPYTIIATAQQDEGQDRYRAFVGTESDTGASNNFMQHHGDENLRIHNETIDADTTNEWAMFSAVVGEDSSTVYINGEEQGTVNLANDWGSLRIAGVHWRDGRDGATFGNLLFVDDELDEAALQAQRRRQAIPYDVTLNHS